MSLTLDDREERREPEGKRVAHQPVALRYFEKLGREAKISDLQSVQVMPLPWQRFSIEALMERDLFRTLVRSLRDRREVYITYEAGSRPGQARKVFPLGLVRNPEVADFLVATEGNNEGDDTKPKRYFLDKISDVKPVALDFGT